MTFEIGLVFAILFLAMLLFVTDALRVDVVAILVLVLLALTGLVASDQVFSGFSSSAVVTVWAVFVLSGALSRTGVAGLIGQQVLKVAGEGELRLVVVIMIVTATLSAFMNNVGVAAMLLPVIMDIAARTGHSPSRLLLPLAYGSLLGGLNTLIGTPPNILASEAMMGAGFEGFGMFDFALVGLPLTLVGIVYMATVGRYLLPARDPAREAMSEDALDEQSGSKSDVKGGAKGDPATAMQADLEAPYALDERLASLRVPASSSLIGVSLGASRLGTALGMNVLALRRDQKRHLAPDPNLEMAAGDVLIVSGRPSRLHDLRSWSDLRILDQLPDTERLFGEGAGSRVAELRLAQDGPLIGQTLRQADFRNRFDLNVLAIGDEDRSEARRADLQDIPLRSDVRVLVLGSPEAIADLKQEQFEKVQVLGQEEIEEHYQLTERLMALTVPADSHLAGVSLVESRLGDAFDLVVLGVYRDGSLIAMLAQDFRMEAGDTLILQGREQDFGLVAGLQSLEIEPGPPPDLDGLESDSVGLAEVILSPHTRVAGQTLRELRWRKKYGLSVLAVLRGGKPIRSNLADLALQLGDALLVYGPHEKMQLIGAEPDYIVLTQAAQAAPRREKAGLSALIMALVLFPVILGWLPIAVSAVAGSLAMILTGCLTVDEAYRYIEWKAVALIAGLLPMGIAMEESGAAALMAEYVVATLSPLGWVAVVGGLFLLTNLATQIMPNPAVAVLMAPIALGAAQDLGMSPEALMMTVAMAASAAVMSPVGHPANVLVMGPGGYRFIDYLKIGLPLTIILMLVTLLVLPWAWPLYP